MSTVVLTRALRDAVYDEIEMELDGALGDIANSLKGGHGERVRDLRERAERAMRLLDDLGWDRADDRVTYPLSMPSDQLAIYAHWRIAQTEPGLHENSRVLAEVAAGADPWGKYRELFGTTIDEDVAGLRGSVDHDLDVLAACRSILAQIDEAA